MFFLSNWCRVLTPTLEDPAARKVVVVGNIKHILPAENASYVSDPAKGEDNNNIHSFAMF
jgi:hypothetical protein